MKSITMVFLKSVFPDGNYLGLATWARHLQSAAADLEFVNWREQPAAFI
jgi:hypothetical protein